MLSPHPLRLLWGYWRTPRIPIQCQHAMTRGSTGPWEKGASDPARVGWETPQTLSTRRSAKGEVPGKRPHPLAQIPPSGQGLPKHFLSGEGPLFCRQGVCRAFCRGLI